MNRIRWAPMGADGDHSERYCAAGAKCLARGVRLAAEEQAQRRPGIADVRAMRSRRPTTLSPATRRTCNSQRSKPCRWH